MIWKIPKNRFVLIAYAAVLYFLNPVMSALFYIQEYYQGTYPPEADAIGIPIFQETVVCIVFSPFYAAIVLYSTRRYTGGASLAAWNRKRPCWSVLWSLFYVIAAGLAVAAGNQLVRLGHEIEGIHAFLAAHLAFLLRSAAVTQGPAPSPTADPGGENAPRPGGDVRNEGEGKDREQPVGAA